jgi:hypothetical protein
LVLKKTASVATTLNFGRSTKKRSAAQMQTTTAPKKIKFTDDEA